MYVLLIVFEYLSFANFLTKAKGIVEKLAAEPALTYFPEPWPDEFPSRLEMGNAYTTYANAYTAALGGDKMARDVRGQTRAVMTGLLKEAAPYLQAVARKAGNPSMLDATGYDRRHVTVKAAGAALPAPVLKLVHGTLSGVIVAHVKRVKGAGSYESQICLGDPSIEANWKMKIITTVCRHIELTGLTPGQLYYVRVRAISSSTNGAWSDIASLMAT